MASSQTQDVPSSDTQRVKRNAPAAAATTRVAAPATRNTPNPSSVMACSGATMRALAAITEMSPFQMAGE